MEKQTEKAIHCSPDCPKVVEPAVQAIEKRFRMAFENVDTDQSVCCLGSMPIKSKKHVFRKPCCNTAPPKCSKTRKTAIKGHQQKTKERKHDVENVVNDD
jgi:hypothetical protein